MNYLKIWLNHFCTSLLQASSSLPPVCSSLLPIHFQSTSSLLPVFNQTPPTSKSTFLCQIFDFLWNYYKLIRYTVWANNDIIDYPLCSIEKTKNEQKKTETKSVNYLKIELIGNLQHIYNITIIESNHICIFFWTSSKILDFNQIATKQHTGIFLGYN